MDAFKAKEVAANVPINAMVAIKLTNDPKIREAYRGQTIKGYWAGVKANPKIHAALLDELNGWHWIGEVSQFYTDEVFDLHLEVIESINVLG